MSIVTTFIQHSFGSPSHGNQGRKRNKRNPNWKRRSKTVTANDTMLYIENPKETTRRLLELINELSKVVGYKVKTQKLLALLYTNNERSEREIKRWDKETEGYTMFLDWKNQYCPNEYTTQGNLEIECNLYQIPMAFFTELEQKILNLYGNTKDPE